MAGRLVLFDSRKLLHAVNEKRPSWGRIELLIVLTQRRSRGCLEFYYTFFFLESGAAPAAPAGAV